MSQTSIDEILSEEDFRPLAANQAERLARLSNALLGKQKRGWTRRHFYQLAVESEGA